MTRICVRHGGTRQGAPAPVQTLPLISVIVPVRNEAAFICQTLEQLLAQNYPPDRFEILVADGQSTDGTPALVRALALGHSNLRLLDNPKRWSSAGRNVAIRAARGDIVVLVDGHCDLANAYYLRALADAFARSGADCVGRPQSLDIRGATPLQKAIALARASRLGHHPDSYIYTATEKFVRPQSVAVAYRRSVFETVGLFDEEFDACEDVELNHRVDQAGLRCFFTHKVRALYHPRSTLRGLFVQMVRYGRGRVRLLRKHPQTFTALGFAPAAFLLGVLGGLPLAVLTPWLAIAYSCGLGLYALTVLLACLAITFRSGAGRFSLWLPVVFVTIHAGAGVGILREGLVGWRPRRNLHERRMLQEQVPC